MTTVQFMKGGFQAQDLVAEPTGGPGVSPEPEVDATTTSYTYRSLTERVGFLRNQGLLVTADVSDLHKQLVPKALEEHAADFSRKTVLDLLESLSDRGFSWRDIARMAGVSVPAVQKWRKGEKASADKRQRLMDLNALVDILESQHHYPEVASWAELPIVRGVPVTAIDLIAANKVELVWELASGHRTAEEALDIFEPAWRETYRSDYVVVRAEDGFMSIVMADEQSRG